jgi:hypothetical protein
MTVPEYDSNQPYCFDTDSCAPTELLRICKLGLAFTCLLPGLRVAAVWFPTLCHVVIMMMMPGLAKWSQQSQGLPAACDAQTGDPAPVPGTAHA